MFMVFHAYACGVSKRILFWEGHPLMFWALGVLGSLCCAFSGQQLTKSPLLDQHPKISSFCVSLWPCHLTLFFGVVLFFFPIFCFFINNISVLVSLYLILWAAYKLVMLQISSLNSQPSLCAWKGLLQFNHGPTLRRTLGIFLWWEELISFVYYIHFCFSI